MELVEWDLHCVNGNWLNTRGTRGIPHAKFIQIGLSYDQCSSALKLLDHCGRIWAVKALEDCRCTCRRLFGSTDVVFDGYELTIYGRFHTPFDRSQTSIISSF